MTLIQAQGPFVVLLIGLGPNALNLGPIILNMVDVSKFVRENIRQDSRFAAYYSTIGRNIGNSKTITDPHTRGVCHFFR